MICIDIFILFFYDIEIELIDFLVPDWLISNNLYPNSEIDKKKCNFEKSWLFNQVFNLYSIAKH